MTDVKSATGYQCNFPLFSKVPESIAAPKLMKSVYFLDSNFLVKVRLDYPNCIGFNFHEIVRIAHCLKRCEEYGVETGVNWVNGQDVVMKRDLEDDGEIFDSFDEFRVVKVDSGREYLRVAKDPGI